jgi:hypothetical protein
MNDSPLAASHMCVSAGFYPRLGERCLVAVQAACRLIRMSIINRKSSITHPCAITAAWLARTRSTSIIDRTSSAILVLGYSAMMMSPICAASLQR